MIIIKCLLFIVLFFSVSYLGLLISKKYTNRVNELKELKSFLNLLKTKIKFTYEPLGEIFEEMSKSFSTNISNFLKLICLNMKSNSVGKSWKSAVENSRLNICEEDKVVLSSLGKLLGKTDLDGQVSQITQTAEFLDIQIEKAENERIKNEKLYKTLGIVTRNRNCYFINIGE